MGLSVFSQLTGDVTPLRRRRGVQAGSRPSVDVEAVEVREVWSDDICRADDETTLVEEAAQPTTCCSKIRGYTINAPEPNV